ncbi:glycoside hydrolase superfamily [Aspergillus egyptiacus]|nr:glycoside hydrolase superfamily [Aspergillus egyptiacus]
MAARLDLAASKGCDGVDPDNVDAYRNNDGGGLGLTAADSVEYVNWLADEAHARGLAVGLKNAMEIIPEVVGRMQWAVNEQCAEYHECEGKGKDKGVREGGGLSRFVEAGKPVFHIEYPKGEEVNDDRPVTEEQRRRACEVDGREGFSTLIKNMDLDEYWEVC